ncbi:MAG: hypothetical protein JOZ57_17915 [Abitibacteriaceae bacterium]|nr:hypothetical protein [Abditibacteriaceae bacterium]
MKEQLPPAAIAGIIAVVVILCGAIGYTMFLRPASEGAAKPANYGAIQQQVTQNPAMQEQMKQQFLAGHPTGRKGGSSSQQPSTQVINQYKAAHPQ